MNRVLSISAGLVVGGLCGLGLALLFTPWSGEELRRTIQDNIDTILEEGRAAAEARRRELQRQLEALKEPAPRQ